MKILIGCPVLYNGETCLRAFKSIIDEADLLIIDNGSDRDVKEAITSFRNQYICAVIPFEKNIYVNAAWNCILREFIGSTDFDQLVIMNSDLIMHPGWSNHLENGTICIPTDGSHTEDEIVTSGTPGVFLHFNREMARLIYPIPSEIRIWYGDEYALTVLRKAGYKTVVKSKMIGTHFHGGSQTCLKLAEFQEIIEQDKLAWLEIEKTL